MVDGRHPPVIEVIEAVLTVSARPRPLARFVCREQLAARPAAEISASSGTTTWCPETGLGSRSQPGQGRPWSLVGLDVAATSGGSRHAKKAESSNIAIMTNAATTMTMSCVVVTALVGLNQHPYGSGAESLVGKRVRSAYARA